MDEKEMRQRVIGILTTCLTADLEGDSLETQLASLIAGLLDDVSLTVASDATPAEIARATLDAQGPQLGLLLGAFCAAYTDLAQEHDEGNPARSAQETLQAFALRAGG
ncbi:hypothetical protein ACFYVL_39955 [Streptomyces sp. NPDC004111]|uniref:hypothetical protein n=1 Tax=Streptomyces sp. NPDC004111 TaxID=3364690 RepID=UPI0036D1F83A